MAPFGSQAEAAEVYGEAGHKKTSFHTVGGISVFRVTNFGLLWVAVTPLF